MIYSLLANPFSDSTTQFLPILIVPTILKLWMVSGKLLCFHQPILKFPEGLTFEVPWIGG
jgi:hypothetical protein